MLEELGEHLLDFDPDCNYYENSITENHVFSTFPSVEDFLNSSNISVNDNNFVTILCQNIRSFNRNLDSFLAMFPANTMPDIFVFSETWHDLNTPVIIPGYTGFHTIREGRSGGVSIFKKNHISVKLAPQFCLANESIEICSVKISSGSNNIMVCGIYRPHSNSIENFTTVLETVISNSLFSGSTCILAGDFNINLFSGGGDVDGFVDMMRSHHYLQTIADTTHPGHGVSAPSLIDHIWINQLCTYNSGVVQTGISDHYTLYIQLPFLTKKSNQEKIKITFRDCSCYNQIKFTDSIRNINWNVVRMNDVNLYLNNFISKVNEKYQENFPVKTKYVTIKYFQNPWHNDDVKKITNARSRYHELLKLGFVSQAEYSRFRNKVTNLVRKCRDTYYQSCFSRNSKNIKNTWKLIRKICTSYHANSIEKLISNGTTYDKPEDIAEIFSDFFSNIANNLTNNLPPSSVSPYEFVARNSHQPIFFDPITQDECSTIIASLKNTKEHIDHISVQIFKKYHYHFLPVLCEIINLSLETGVFPNCLKHAIVIPIFKKGDQSNATNYRPIALLPFIGKIFERCIFARLSNYAIACNIISTKQFGFTKGKSTQDAIILLMEKIYECFNAGDGSFCLNVFIDFQKCFDMIDHAILINKLRMYGVTGKALDLIENYLSGRTQSVRVCDALSSPRAIVKGVPQGSIIGPLLFLFFINDLANISENMTTILFADDTTLSFTA